LYIPWAITSVGLVFNPNIPYYIDIGLNGIVAIANFVLTVQLYHMRLELRPKYLDETSSLLVYSILSLIEWIFANTLYILAFLVDISGVIIYYMYIELVLVGLMWSLTTGRLVHRVWVRRDIVGDKKPELATQDIHKALQRVSVMLDTETCNLNGIHNSNNNKMEERTYKIGVKDDEVGSNSNNNG
jgi:hypothetical protein